MFSAPKVLIKNSCSSGHKNVKNFVYALGANAEVVVSKITHIKRTKILCP
jgi:hypothetical protein